jgi:hypothetical protein
MHDLVSKSLADELSADERRAFEQWLRDDPEARKSYAFYLHDTAELRWICSKIEEADESVPDVAVVRSRRLGVAWMIASAAAAVCLLAAIWIFGFNQSPSLDGESLDGESLVKGPPVNDPLIDKTPVDQPPVDQPLAEKTGADQATNDDAVATVARLSGAKWGDRTEAFAERSRLKIGDVIDLDAGELGIVFDRGVELVARGRCRFRIVSPLHVIGEVGALSARVEESGRGFRIDTPNTRIVDRGTEFGLSIDQQGQTDVVCYEGMVELNYESTLDPSQSGRQDRLFQGEGLHIDSGGTARRLVYSTDMLLPSAPRIRRPTIDSAPVIAAVRDTLRDTASRKSYRILRGGFDEDAQAYVDRPHQWNGVDRRGIPEMLKGADYIMPFNDDKFIDDIEVHVDLAGPAVVYVLLSDGVAPPTWLIQRFEDTGVDVGLDEGSHSLSPATSLGVGPGESIDTVFSVWRCEVSRATTIPLGAIERPEILRGYNMYAVVAKSLAR